ncbi:MAG: hypothetical protein HC886_23425 [Leptolyngbyaceae cyanobacterium SM1_1_3]|nr:hypothetical protein [Leptolyngbyaceae cyanobacterium SM1_1_3]NJN04824.1 hypothetical protein [Leptolyngbyaceae cyanobacterium RM1_1_2]
MQREELIPVYAVILPDGKTQLSYNMPPDYIEQPSGELLPVEESRYTSKPRRATAQDILEASFLLPEDEGKQLELADGDYEVTCIRRETPAGQATYSLDLERL